MKRMIPLFLAATIAVSGAAFATSDAAVTPEVAAQIRTILEADGYEVRRIESEDGMFEAYALRDGDRFEIYFDAAMQIVRTARDD